MSFGAEHRIYKAVRRNPFSLYESFIKSAGIKIFIAADHLRRKRGIILHSKMEIKHILLLFFQNPLVIKPVKRVLGIAVEPIFGILKRAPRKRLFNKGAGHKRRLVKHNASQGHTLNQRGRRFITPAEKVKAVAPSAPFYLYKVAAELVTAGKAKGGKNGNQRRYNIAPERRYRFAADCERSFIEAVKCPADKGNAHTKRFSRAHSAVTYYSVFISGGTALAPPRKNGKLFRRKRVKAIRHNHRRGCLRRFWRPPQEPCKS